MIIGKTEKDGLETFYVESSNILLIEYIRSKQELIVSFKNGGVYSYFDVSDDRASEFIMSESQGKYLNTILKKNHEVRKQYTLNNFEIEDIIKKGMELSNKKEIISTKPTLELSEYQAKAIRTRAPLSDQYKYMDTVHMLLGMITEVGELSDPFKKHLAYGKEIDWVNVREELADIMWYIANFCDLHNINLKEELGINIKKLEERFPEKFFTSKDAIDRNLSKERNILEGN